MTINAEAFRILYRATKATPDDKFDMRVFAHPCGTPACLFGNYAASPEQNTFRVETADSRRAGIILLVADGTPINLDHDELLADHFGITEDEVRELFDETGCGGSEEVDFGGGEYRESVRVSKSEALAYVKQFCADRGVEL